MGKVLDFQRMNAKEVKDQILKVGGVYTGLEKGYLAYDLNGKTYIKGKKALELNSIITDRAFNQLPKNSFDDAFNKQVLTLLLLKELQKYNEIVNNCK